MGGLMAYLVAHLDAVLIILAAVLAVSIRAIEFAIRRGWFSGGEAEDAEDDSDDDDAGNYVAGLADTGEEVKEMVNFEAGVQRARGAVETVQGLWAGYQQWSDERYERDRQRRLSILAEFDKPKTRQAELEDDGADERYGAEGLAHQVRAAAPVSVLPMKSWMQVLNNRPDDAPHLFVYAPSGSGKTTFVRGLLVGRRGSLVVCDPKYRPGKWGDVAAMSEFTEMDTVFKAILTEQDRRFAVFKRTPHHQPLDFEPLTVLIDDFFLVNQRTTRASEVFAQVSSVGREVGIRLIAVSTSNRVKSLGIEGQGDIRDQFALVCLGDAAFDLATSTRDDDLLDTLDVMERPAVLEVRGRRFPIDTSRLLELQRASLRLRAWDAHAKGQVTEDDNYLADLLGGHTGMRQTVGQKSGLDTTKYHTSMAGISDIDAENAGMTSILAQLAGMGRDQRIQVLVTLGVSANGIAQAVGGDRNAVIAKVRELRGGQD